MILVIPWINLVLLILPLFVLLAPLYLTVWEVNNAKDGEFDYNRRCRRRGVLMLAVYLAAVALTIFLIPELLQQPRYQI